MNIWNICELERHSDYSKIKFASSKWQSECKYPLVSPFNSDCQNASANIENAEVSDFGILLHWHFNYLMLSFSICTELAQWTHQIFWATELATSRQTMIQSWKRAFTKKKLLILAHSKIELLHSINTAIIGCDIWDLTGSCSTQRVVIPNWKAV